MPQIQNCCCCVTLKTGSVIIGVVTLSMSLIFIVLSSLLAYQEALLEDIVSIILHIVYLISSIMLIYGSVKNNRWMVFSWILVTVPVTFFYITMMLIVSSIYVLIDLHYAIFGSREQNLSIFMFVSPAVIILTCIGFYLWLCVIARFQEIADSAKNDTTLTKIVQLQKKKNEELKKEIDQNKGPNEQIKLGNLYTSNDKSYYYEDQENNRKGPENFYSKTHDDVM